MKKTKAKFLRNLHCLKHVLKLEIGHREIDAGDFYYFCGIQVWSNISFVGCECGKVFYNNGKNVKIIIKD